jgi:hypothetical protein
MLMKLNTTAASGGRTEQQGAANPMLKNSLSPKNKLECFPLTILCIRKGLSDTAKSDVQPRLRLIFRLSASRLSFENWQDGFDILRLSLSSLQIRRPNISGANNKHEQSDMVQSEPQPRLTLMSRLFKFCGYSQDILRLSPRS